MGYLRECLGLRNHQRGVYFPCPRETTDCYHYYGSCCTADISTDGNSYVPAKPQLDTWTPHHGDNGRWVSSLAYFHFRSGRERSIRAKHGSGPGNQAPDRCRQVSVSVRRWFAGQPDQTSFQCDARSKERKVPFSSGDWAYDLPQNC